MTVRQVAKNLEISPSLVYGLIAAGRLKCTRHGIGRGTIRVSEDQVRAYMENAAKAQPAPQPLRWIR